MVDAESAVEPAGFNHNARDRSPGASYHGAQSHSSRARESTSGGRNVGGAAVIEQRVRRSFPRSIMPTLNYTEAFRFYKAKLANPMWAYSAIAKDGALVISCWSHKLKLQNGVLTYTDRLSRWDLNSPGKNLLTQHLREGLEQGLAVRLIVATTDQPDVVDRGEAADKISKTFHVKPEVVGTVTLFDGDNFLIDFRKK